MRLILVVKYLPEHLLNTKQIRTQSDMTEGEVQYFTVIVPKMSCTCLNKRKQRHALAAIWMVKRERGIK